MRGGNHVVDLRVAEDLQARLHQLGAYNHRQQATEHPAHKSEAQVHRAYVLVIGRVGPTPPAARAVVSLRIRSISHGLVAMLVGLAEKAHSRHQPKRLLFGFCFRHNAQSVGCHSSATKDRAPIQNTSCRSSRLLAR